MEYRKFLKSTAFGAISGAVSFGIGSAFSTATEAVKAFTGFTKFLVKAGISIAQAGVHGYAQGILSLAQGGTFEQAFVAGALGSLGASAFSMSAGSFSESGVGKVLFGAVSGGVGSELSGGNFWEGVVIGGMVAGLNHAMHRINGNPLRKQLRNEFEGTGMDPDGDAIFCDYEELIEKLPTLKTMLDKTKSTFHINDELGKGVDGKQVKETNRIDINTTELSTKLNYAYTLGHEMLHVFDSMYNYTTIMNVLGKTTNGSHGYKFYKEYRSFMWEYNLGNKINVSSYLKNYIFDFNKSGVDKVYNNLNKLNSSVINP